MHQSFQDSNKSLNKLSKQISVDLKAIDIGLQERIVKILRPEQRHALVIVDKAYSL